MNVKNFDSSTDVSSDSSWTVIEEIPENSISDIANDLKSNQNVCIELIETTEIITIPDSYDEEKFVEVNFPKGFVKHCSDESSDSSKNEIGETGFISFEEYLQEWMLEDDNPCQIQSNITNQKLNKPKNSTKIKSKCKAETIGILALCASLLTVTGIALLFIVSSGNIDPKNFESMKNNCQATVENYSVDSNNIVGSLNKSMEVLQAAPSRNISITSAYNLNNIPDLASKYSIGPMNEIWSSRYHRKNRNKYNTSASIFSKNNFTRFGNRVCYSNEDPRLFAWKSKKQRNKLGHKKNLDRRSNSTVIETPITTNQNNTRKTLYPVESVLNSTNLKTIIRSIIHDICILKLITYLNKNVQSQEQDKKSSKGEKKRSKRKLFGANKDGLDVIIHDTITGRKTRTAKRKTTLDNQLPSHQYRSIGNAMSDMSKYIDKTLGKNAIQKYSRQCTSNPKTELPSKFENGNSKYRRLSEELDNNRKRSQELCSNHNNNVLQIKQHYRNEIYDIKHSNTDLLTKMHWMQMLKEIYKFHLKKNRLVYTREMSKIKRLRWRMLRDLSSIQKKSVLRKQGVTFESSEVPIEQVFYSHLQQMKGKDLIPNKFIDLGFRNSNTYNGIEYLFQQPKSSQVYSSSPKLIDKDISNERTHDLKECIRNKRQCKNPEKRLRPVSELRPCITMQPRSYVLERSSKEKVLTPTSRTKEDSDNITWYQKRL